MAWLNSASISPLDQGHDDTNEEKHLALLHTEEEKKIRTMSIYVKLEGQNDRAQTL